MGKMYNYEWLKDGTLRVKIKRGRAIKFQIGNASFAVNLRRPPKKIMLAVTGKATARKGLLPNSLFPLGSEWHWEIKSVSKQEKTITDDKYTQGTFEYLQADVDKSKNIEYNTFTPDGATLLDENQVQKLNW